MRTRRFDPGWPMAHTALLFDEDHGRRVSVHDWVGTALDAGDKVCYLTADLDAAQWIARSPQPSAAQRSGQLSVLLAQDIVQRAGGDCARVRAAMVDTAHGALAAGYPGVALTAEHSARALLAPRRQDRVAVEQELDTLVSSLPIRVLCQYDTMSSSRAWILEASALHYAAMKDELCSARRQRDRLLLRGEIDASNGDRVATAWQAALRDGVAVFDLAEVDFLAVDSLRRLSGLAAGLADAGRSLTLVNLPPQVRRAAAVARVDDARGLELEQTDPA